MMGDIYIDRVRKVREEARKISMRVAAGSSSYELLLFKIKLKKLATELAILKRKIHGPALKLIN